MAIKAVTTAKAPAALGPYAQGVQAGPFFFTSGQLGLDPVTGQLASGGVEAQTHQAMANLKEVLAAAGTDLGAVVKTTIFVKDLNDFATVNQVYGSYLQQPYPARSTLEVARLPKDALVEIEMTAFLG